MAAPKQGHTACHRGKRVRVTLWTGEVIIDKFVTRTHNALVFEVHGKIAREDVRSFAIYKEYTHAMRLT